jgi:hypothetical protein
MPRKIIAQIPGARYHVMSRGDQRDDILEDKVSDNHPGRERLETTAAKAERLIARELVRLNWTSA